MRLIAVLGLLILASSCLVLAQSPPATVPGNAICVKAGSTGTNGASWADAVATIEDALTLANSSRNEIWVAGAEGDGITYSEPSQGESRASQTAILRPSPSPDSAGGSPPWLVITSGLKLYGGYAGSDDAPTLRDPATYLTILSSYGPTVEFNNSANSIIDGFVFYDAVGVKLVNSTTQVSHNHFCSTTGVHAQSSSGAICDNWFSGEYCGIEAQDSACTIYNNVVEYASVGISCGGSDASTVANNTVVYCWDGVLGCSGTTIANNIVAFQSEEGVVANDSSAPYLSHNCVYHNGTDPDWLDYVGIGPDQHPTDISGDPEFANPYYDDYHFFDWSPCLNSGDNTLIQSDTDLDGHARPQGSGVDIGAYELGAPVVYVTDSGYSANDGLSWDYPKGDLQEAIEVADSMDPKAEVWVACDCSGPNLADGVAVYGGFSGWESDRNQRNLNSNVTTIYGTVTASYCGSGTRLDGFTVTGAMGGSGVDCEHSDLIVANNIITENQGTNGGGILCLGGAPAIVNNTISGNSTMWDTDTGHNGNGAGIYCQGSGATVSGNTIFDNPKAEYYEYPPQSGGGIYVTDGAAPEGAPTILRNVIQGNGAYGAGSGIYCASAGARISDNVITDNEYTYYGQPQGQGGGLYLALSGTDSPYVTNNTFRNNEAADGGGVYIAGGTAHLVNNIVAGNSSGVWFPTGSNTDNVSYNDVYGNGSENYPESPTGANNRSVDPAFCDTTGYRIRPYSQCTGVGDNSVVQPGETDAEGQPRIHGAFVDLGAYETSNCGVRIRLVAPAIPTPIGQQATVAAHVTDNSGAPLSNTVAFSPSGNCNPSSSGANVYGDATTQVSSTNVGQVTITATTPDACGSAQDTTTVTFYDATCGWNLVLATSAPRGRINTSVDVTATLTDSAGRPVNGEPITFSASPSATASVSPTIVNTVNGIAVSHVSSSVYGTVTVTASTTDHCNNPVSGTADLTFWDRKVGFIYDLCLEAPNDDDASRIDSYLTSVAAAYPRIEYQQITGVPFTIDTSFNVVLLAIPVTSRTPLAQSELDALRAFVNSGRNKRLVLVGEFSPNYDVFNSSLNDIAGELGISTRFCTGAAHWYDQGIQQNRFCEVDRTHYLMSGVEDLCDSSNSAFAVTSGRALAYLSQEGHTSDPWIVEEDTPAAGSRVLIHDCSMFYGGPNGYGPDWDTVPEWNFLFVYNLCTIFQN